MLHAVILAGGSGTRLWPESRAARPKQFLAVEGDRTLLQATVDRLGSLVPPERVLIATNKHLAGEIQAHLSHLPRSAILAEPYARNTAPCIGLAAIRILRDDPDATMVVLPADQIISPPAAFQDAIRLGAALVDEDPRRLVTFGIRPTYAATGFGYIEQGEPLRGPAGAAGGRAFRVKRFHEKPARSVAEQYLAAGRFAWNAGIFLWRAQTILDALAQYRPDLHARLMCVAQAVDRPQFPEILDRQFQAMEKISIDFAVMEAAEGVVVVEAEFQWDDVGSWLALKRYRPHDEQGNVPDAPRALAINTTGTLVRCQDAGHAVVVAGVKDLVVVVTPDATLVANKHDEKSLAAVTEELRKRGWTEYL